MNRNHGLDFLKFLCCLCVICIHVSFPEPIGSIVIPITRIAVPIFFMITGYYYSYIREKGGSKRQLSKMLKLCILGNALYLFWKLILNWVQGNSLTEFVRSTINLEAIFKFVLLNDSPFNGHLWYLGAILYTLLIVYLWEKKWNRKKLYPIVPFLLLLDLVFGKYSLLILGKEFPYILVRNFLCVGLPYFLIGDMLFKSKLEMKSNVLILLIILFTGTTLAERYLLGIMNVNAARDHYFSTTFLAISVFLLALQCQYSIDNNWYRIICFVGSKLSLSIYLIHPILIPVTDKIIKFVVHNNPSLMRAYRYVAPFVVLLVSTIVAWGFYALKNTIKIKRKSSNV